MSFKYQVQKISDNHYVLPKVKDMRTEVHAYLSQHLYDLSEENVWLQAFNAASHEGVIGVYLMPDCHVGYGIPVGGVVVTEDVIIQSGSGYDISCGVLYMRVPGLHAQDVASWDKRDSWIREVEKRIALGVGSGRPVYMPDFKDDKIQQILRFGAKAIGVDANICERQYIEVGDNVDVAKIEKAYEKAKPQLGSVGGGNHFIEMQVDEKDGSVWVMIHCGSRGYGWQTANHFFYEGAKVRGLASNHREQSWLRIDEPLGKEYWAHHNAAANYAIANRHVIVNGVQEALHKVFKVEGKVFYEISHNLVQEETLVLPDGTTKKGFVHRKGATRAFPAGHPDLIGTEWEVTGHPCLIPGSMYDGAAILFPLPGAYNTACSVNHGSGRVMARGEAKRKLEHKQQFIDDQMRNTKRTLGNTIIRGVVGNTKKTPLDECGHVYKDLDEVLFVLEGEGIARVAHRLYPVANLKGMD
jgi:tRNA-splicing ligase RtcB